MVCWNGHHAKERKICVDIKPLNTSEVHPLQKVVEVQSMSTKQYKLLYNSTSLLQYITCRTPNAKTTLYNPASSG